MLSPKLKQDVFKLWTLFQTSGLTNPLTAIEQITYLLFIKWLESLDAKRRDQGKRSIFGRRRNCQLLHHRQDAAHALSDWLPYGADAGEYKNCIGHGTCKWSFIKRGIPTSIPLDSDPYFKEQNERFKIKYGYRDEIDAMPSGRDSQVEDHIFNPTRVITPHDHLSQYVFPWLRELERTLQEIDNPENGLQEVSNRLQDAYFQLPREKTETLQSVIQQIDELFQQVGTGAANADIISDTFEYLLSEIEISARDGLFRTPRHIIRFMVELLDPQPGQRMIDPAAGTCGFLINSIQHILKNHTNPETVVLEWDGTPHRIYGGNPGIEKYLTGTYFTGYDNDRTMTRIGWMNLILHGVESPNILLRDSLDKNEKYESDSGAYDLAIANPPFTGTVDSKDLPERRFPHINKGVTTNKSELLFMWLLLDLLKRDGRAAVIVPEGLLLGSTTAHKELRRQLLLENRLEGVISLPAGVFQPHSSVKTSILVFQKIGGEFKAGDKPHTNKVWFYEVAADGYTLDAKRNDKPEPNDLWDALAKWKNKAVDQFSQNLTYYKPEFFDVRWRMVDDKLIGIFPNLEHEKDNILGIHELFSDLPRNPEEATTQIVTQQKAEIRKVFWSYLINTDAELADANRQDKAVQTQIKKAFQPLNKKFNSAMQQMLEKGFEDFGRKALSATLEMVQKELEEKTARESRDVVYAVDNLMIPKIEVIVREFAKLDGFNIQLRSLPIYPQEELLSESKSWVAPVRVIARVDDWQSADGKVTGNFDESGNVRREFLEDQRIYKTGGTIKAEYLEANCIEANDFNLSASRYKPFTIAATHTDVSAKKLIEELQIIESRIQDGLGRLLAMMGSEK